MSNRYYIDEMPISVHSTTVLRVYPASMIRSVDIYGAWSITTVSEEFIRRTDIPIPDTWTLLKGMLYEAP